MFACCSSILLEELRMKIRWKPWLKFLESMIIFLVERLIKPVAGFSAFFIRSWNIIFVKDMMIWIQCQKSQNAPFYIREMSVIIWKVSLVFFFKKLFLDLVKQIFFTWRVDADFINFNVCSHWAVFLTWFDPIHVNLVHNCAVELGHKEAISFHGLVLIGFGTCLDCLLIWCFWVIH